MNTKRNKLIKNEYGNVDIRNGVPEGLVHVQGERIGPTAKSLGIDYAPAMYGWNLGANMRPLIDGVVVSKRDAKQLIAAIEERKDRAEKTKHSEALEILKQYVDLVFNVAANDYAERRIMPNPMLQVLAALVSVQSLYEHDVGGSVAMMEQSSDNMRFRCSLCDELKSTNGRSYVRWSNKKSDGNYAVCKECLALMKKAKAKSIEQYNAKAI